MLEEFLKIFEDIMYFERYAGSKGILQQINPLIKIVSLLTIILSAIVAKTICLLVIPFAIIIILCIFSRIPLKYFIKRATLFIPIFAAAIASPLILTTPGTSLVNVSLGFIVIRFTIEGLEKAFLFTFRIWICVATLNLLVLTTKFSQIIYSMNKLRLPFLFIIMTAITYRFIFLFINEAYRMILAKESRTSKRESILRNLKSITNIFATLFVRAFEKGERVYLAMLARGFDPKSKSVNEISIRSTDYLFLTGSFIIFIVILSNELFNLTSW